MSDQDNAAASTSTGGKAYNVKITPKSDIEVSANSNNTKKIKFRGQLMQRGKLVERTVVAQGKAADAIEAVLATGKEVGLRCLFSRAPANDEGKRGGEFLTAIGLPLPPKQKAA